MKALIILFLLSTCQLSLVCESNAKTGGAFEQTIIAKACDEDDPGNPDHFE